MDTQHAKSPCCRGDVCRFGGRRRQCTACKRTWRIRQKHRGRKRLRTTTALALRYLRGDATTIRASARLRGWNRDRAHQMLTRSLTQLIVSHRAPWHDRLPTDGPLIAIADAIWYRIRGHKTTVYLLFVRPVMGDRAVVAPFVIRHGHEDRQGWDAAFATIPESLRTRMRAVVCDGGLGVVASVRYHGWPLQRCHFHLLANLQMYCGTRTPWARQLLADVRTLLMTRDRACLQRSCRRLARARTETRSRGIRRILGGFLATYEDFRTHRRYPELQLPTTTNTAESYISGMQDLKRRVRGFRTIAAMERWWTAYIIVKPTIQCNGTSTK